MIQRNIKLLYPIALAVLISACTPPVESGNDRFVVADLFATPGKALATVALSATPPLSPTPEASPEGTALSEATAALPTFPNPNQPTQPVPTFNPRLPTLPPPTPTPTETPTPTPTSTPVPATPTPTDNPCAPDNAPFEAVFLATPAIRSLLGCAGPELREEPAVFQPFENGYMILLTDIDAIFTITTERINNDDASSDDWFRFTNRYDGTNDPTFSETPPDGLFEPARGFGILWLSNDDLRNQMGWATAPTEDYITDLVPFQDGLMLHGPDDTPVFALGLNESTQNSGTHLGPLP